VPRPNSGLGFFVPACTRIYPRTFLDIPRPTEIGAARRPAPTRISCEPELLLKVYSTDNQRTRGSGLEPGAEDIP
jgi:hypothetical protein